MRASRISSLAERELPEDLGRRHRGLGDALAEPPQRLGDARDARLVGGVEEEGPEKRTDDPIAEPQPPLAHAVGQPGAHRAGRFTVEQGVPVVDRGGHR